MNKNSESEIDLCPYLYLLFLIFPTPHTLPPTPCPDDVSRFLSGIREYIQGDHSFYIVRSRPSNN
ncbi:hypothetical protein, partial [Dendronalium phyllosphericum]|uniref:hypothetical protein n=1 Tax=Dendronalium phyllosphericum TaxID=2840445 RepID=UPI001BDD7CA5